MRAKVGGLALGLLLATSGAARAEKCPNMLILLDRSSSMSGAKWEAALQAISAFTAGRQEVMRFGLMLFPAPGGTRCGGGRLEVSCDFYGAAAIDAALGATSPGGMTPTAAAVESAGTTADLADGARRRFVILVTDGDPTCPGEELHQVDDNLALAVQALSQVTARGIKTFVIGFGQDASPHRLDQLAQAGGTARVGATCGDPSVPGGRLPCKYYEASDRASLEQAFDAIATAASGELQGRSCDDSCYPIGGCPQGQRCVQEVRSYPGDHQLNLGACVADPCAGVGCPDDMFCRDGSCKPACLQPCSISEVCRDGACIADPCAGGGCACSQGCARFLICQDGSCADDPCRYVRCPEAAPYCDRGSCYAAAESSRPVSSPPPSSASASSSGCGCGAGGGLFAALLLPLWPPALGRRRARA